jgi:hypothetical protein
MEAEAIRIGTARTSLEKGRKIYAQGLVGLGILHVNLP